MGTRITRKTQKIFASAAGGTGVAEFGSTAAGSTVYTTDPAVIQSVQFEDGLAAGIIAGTKRLPVYEEINGVYYVGTRQLAYLFQEGIPEYDTGTEYFAKSVVRKAATYELYGSIGNNNIGNALPAAVTDANWTYLGDLSLLAGGAPFVDTTAIVKGSADATKLLRFEVDGFTTGTTRVMTPPNFDGTLATLAGSEALTNKSVNGVTLTTGGSASQFLNGAGSYATAGVFTLSFTSADQTITSAGSLTLAHSLGVAPKIIYPEIVCQTGEAGYSAGDVVAYPPTTAAGSSGLNANYDSTNVYIHFNNSGSALLVSNKSTGAVAGLTNANWKLRVKAWA